EKPGETGEYVIGKRLLRREVIHRGGSLREVNAVCDDYTMSSSLGMAARSVEPSAVCEGRRIRGSAPGIGRSGLNLPA
ncbi:hypothetical protein, partial [Paraburkholderia sp. EG304]|uniref:hypothetical protein n=1 Tax=Paraburkholderia sp. EG304 TaxID=3237015 RepID=UPI003979C0E4